MTTPLTLLDGVRWEGRELPGGRGPALLAALVGASPRSLGVDDLVEQVWAGDEPTHPDKAVQVLVSRARSQTSPDVVARAGSGYRLGLREDQVDALRLRQLVREAELALAAGDLDVARLQARAAAEVAVTTPAADGPLGSLVATARREQESARDLLGSVLLGRGDAAEALPLLEESSARHPGDEHRFAELLRAEAQVRGVASALARWAAYVEDVRERVGAEPGEELRRLHADLLARDRPVRSGLKHAATPLVGRDGDVARIRALLQRSRVVSVVGAGGLGKTRMAHLVGQVAEQPVVHLVELAGVTAPEDVLPEIGAALGVRESRAGVRPRAARGELRGRVAEQLAGPPTLLVLDNCEHLVEAVADVVASLVATVPSVTVLTTSRAPLGLAAEQVYLLPELDVDHAVELFGQRARSARPGARLDDAEVRGLVARLDGLPLAIELAAAKVRVMSVAEITRRLVDRFALLAGRDPSAPDRHQTLEAVIDWSWNLLGEPERAALRTLTAFPDGFSLDGAGVLLGADPVPVLTELVDQSLLVVREGERLRYRFLETVREYGELRLAGAGERDLVRARLRDWAVATARACSHRLFGPEQVETMQDLHAEAGNLAGVMRSALEDGDVRAVVPLAGALIGFWTIRGDHLAVMSSAEELLAAITGAPASEPGHDGELRAVLAALVATTLVFRGAPPASGVARLRALGLAGDGSRTDAVARVVLGVADSADDLVASLDRLAAHPDPTTVRLALQWSTLARENVGELEGALDAGLRALALCDDEDGPWARALLHTQVSSLYSQGGDWARAVEHALPAVPVMRAVGAEEDVLSLRGVVAMTALADGRVEEGARLVDELVADEDAGATVGWRTNALGLRAEVALAQGRIDDGLDLLLQCIDATVERRLTGQLDDALMPWVLYAESAALFAHVRHGRADRVTWLVERSRAKLPGLFTSPAIDLPVLGGVLLALGSWGIVTGRGDRDAAVELVALGHRFGYPRYLPTMAWVHVRELVDPVAPHRLDALADRWSGVPAQDLRGRAQEALARL
jgi:predicted ATPase/DNA-binding SARP family transcriptional activator